MKKIVLALAAALMMSTSMQAQENNDNRERRQYDPEKMVEKRTEQTVKAYNLNEKQAAQLLELNKKYMGKMGHRPNRMGRPDGNHKRPEGQPQAKRDTTKAPRMHQGGDRKQFMENMKAYDEELQKIMTEEQYKAYKADMEKRRQQGPRGQRRERKN